MNDTIEVVIRYPRTAELKTIAEDMADIGRRLRIREDGRFEAVEAIESPYLQALPRELSMLLKRQAG